MADTIAAISTAQAAGGIGIVRLSGPQSRAIADRTFRAANGQTLADLPGYRALYGKVLDGEEVFDEAIALVFAAPHSYTGEDVVELSCHGGLVLVNRLLRAVLTAGARPAGPGEFTRRAFMNGKIDLAEAEAVMGLIRARGEGAARAALAVKDGALSRKIASVQEDLLNATAWLAAWADYPEEDIPAVDRSQLTDRLQNCLNQLSSLLRQFNVGRAIREGVDTVIAGRPNVGKSTLMNLLSGRESSIVTDIPGTTRDIVEETVQLGNIILRLSDTAGLRDTADTVEQLGVSRARSRLEQAEFILAVFDASQPLSPEDKMLLDQIQGRPCVAVINKSDLPSRIDAAYIAQRIPNTITLSAHQEDSAEKLAQICAQVLGTKEIDPSEGLLQTERQRDCVQRSAAELQEALRAVQTGYTLDAVSVCIDRSLAALMELTGERITDAVVDTVFHQFCVGK